MARKARSDGAKFAIETAAALAKPLPDSPVPLSPLAAKFWPRVIGSKRPDAWTAIDLELAAGLCEDLALLEQMRTVMQTEDPFYRDPKTGKIQQHPALDRIEELHRRVLATNRALMINSASTNGRSIQQRNQNEAARGMAATAADDDDGLFARPK